MSIETRLSLFQELVRCNYDVYLWSYTPDLKLISTNCPHDMINSDTISFLNFSGPLLDYAKKKKPYPFILDTALGLLWIAAFEYDKDELQNIHLLGPAFTGKNSSQIFRNELDKRDLTVRLRSQISRQVENIPIIPSMTVFQYALMLHYCITEERITTQDIQYPFSHDDNMTDNVKRISEEHRGIWAAEQEFMQMIREGNPNYKTALEKSSSLSSGVKFDVGDSVRQQKTTALVLLTLCSRAAMEGGLTPSVSYTLSDHYTQCIEEAQTMSQLSVLCRTILEDYVQQVRLSREDSSVSRQIRNVCDYITMHLTEELSINFLADFAGYTEYYFSHKFKKEMGCGVNDYIRRKRIDKAKLLLSSTKKSIQEISDELSFGSRSHFSTVFQKIVGNAPSEYRATNSKF